MKTEHKSTSTTEKSGTVSITVAGTPSTGPPDVLVDPERKSDPTQPGGALFAFGGGGAVNRKHTKSDGYYDRLQERAEAAAEKRAIASGSEN